MAGYIVLFAGAAVYGLFLHDSGWFGKALLGMGALYCAYLAAAYLRLGSRPIVRIDAFGVTDLRLHKRRIPWQAIDTVSVIYESNALLLFLRPGSELKPRRFDFGLGPISGSFGALTARVSFAGLSPGLEAAWPFLADNFATKMMGGWPGKEPLPVLPGEPGSWPLSRLLEDHIRRHADGKLMVVASKFNLLAFGVLLALDIFLPSGLPVPLLGILGFLLLCPLFGFLVFMRLNDRYETDRSTIREGAGFLLQLLFALLPWMTLLKAVV